MKIKIRNSVLSSVIGLVILSLGWIASASAQADFYKGKTITVYAGTTPGALYDQWSRILAMHMGKHIPGKPDMIVQNMPGAGHKIAANYVYAKTKPDGLSLIGSIVPSLYFDQLIEKRSNTIGANLSGSVLPCRVNPRCTCAPTRRTKP